MNCKTTFLLSSICAHMMIAEINDKYLFHLKQLCNHLRCEKTFKSQSKKIPIINCLRWVFQFIWLTFIVSTRSVNFFRIYSEFQGNQNWKTILFWVGVRLRNLVTWKVLVVIDVYSCVYHISDCSKIVTIVKGRTVEEQFNSFDVWYSNLAWE